VEGRGIQRPLYDKGLPDLFLSETKKGNAVESMASGERWAARYLLAFQANRVADGERGLVK
jgi:hypothetical protein